MIEHLTPAAVAISAFGGVRKLSAAIGCAQAAPSRWSRQRGDGARAVPAGMIPAAQQIKILRLAIAKGIAITAEDLILGRDIEVPAAALRR